MNTYTFIAEYKGGTYISQIKGAASDDACLAWARHVAQSGDIPLKNKTSFTKTLQSDLEEIPPVCLDNLLNVWYFIADAGKGYIHVNMVKTDLQITDSRLQLDAEEVSADAI